MMPRIMQPISSRKRIILGLVGIFCLFMGYEWLSYRQHLYNPTDSTIPSLSQLWDGFLQTVTPRDSDLKSAFGIDNKNDKSFWNKTKTTMLYQDLTSTYYRLFAGLFWGCLVSILLGVLMGCYEELASFLLPTLSFLSKVPGTAMLAVFFVVVGTGESMFSAMIGFGILPTLTQSVYLSARDDLHEEEINKAYTLGASNFEVAWNVVWRQILPKVIDNVRLHLGPAMVYLIAAEMLVGQVGMGYQIRMQQRLLNMAIVYDYILFLGLTGLALDRFMNVLRAKICPWYEKLK